MSQKLEIIMFSKTFSPFTKQKPDRRDEADFPCFNLKYDLLAEISKKPLTLTSTRIGEIGSSLSPK